MRHLHAMRHTHERTHRHTCGENSKVLVMQDMGREMTFKRCSISVNKHSREKNIAGIGKAKSDKQTQRKKTLQARLISKRLRSTQNTVNKLFLIILKIRTIIISRSIISRSFKVNLRHVRQHGQSLHHNRRKCRDNERYKYKSMRE